MSSRRRVRALINYRTACFEQARARMTKALRAAAAQGVSAADLVVEGRAYRQILQAAAEQHTDLIIMGVHGRGALDMLFLGSTTNQVVRAAACPVLTLRTG